MPHFMIDPFLISISRLFSWVWTDLYTFNGVEEFLFTHIFVSTVSVLISVWHSHRYEVVFFLVCVSQITIDLYHHHPQTSWAFEYLLWWQVSSDLSLLPPGLLLGISFIAGTNPLLPVAISACLPAFLLLFLPFSYFVETEIDSRQQKDRDRDALHHCLTLTKRPLLQVGT